ncbi:TRAP transporter small permease [Hoeflea sp. YIM 152468]|uniref:TRAP transporter small permease n=1 Tax=Hoeflea sp. YIM 152468 TaxID=3031759 RepID=UPI0023DAE6EE|nr:TRAP transporter small permease [Hoeflea sp. YIM 152468]MDF1608596.1 TRAP transporter small permease [Hoeflea sp. YIM 152468]
MAKFKRTSALGLEYLALGLAVLATMIMTGIVAVIVTSVVMRRFANSPLHIAEDLIGLMLSASLFLGLPLVTLRAQHIRVSIVAEALKARFETPVRVAALLVGLMFFGWIVFEAIPWLEFAWKRNLKTENSRVLLYPWMAVLPLSLGLTWLIFLARLVGVLEPENHMPLESLPDIAVSDGQG